MPGTGGYTPTYVHPLETTPLAGCIEKKERKDRFSIPRVFQPPPVDEGIEGMDRSDRDAYSLNWRRVTDGGKAMAMADEHCERIGSQLILTDPSSRQRARGDIRGRDGGVAHNGTDVAIVDVLCACVCVGSIDRGGLYYEFLRLFKSRIN